MSNPSPGDQDLGPEEALSYVEVHTRIAVAKAAFKCWFRVCPGHSERRQRWLALYYRKIPSKLQLHDSVLGRHVVDFIRQEVRDLNIDAAPTPGDGDSSGRSALINARKDSYKHVRLAQPGDDPLVFVHSQPPPPSHVQQQQQQPQQPQQQQKQDPQHRQPEQQGQQEHRRDSAAAATPARTAAASRERQRFVDELRSFCPGVDLSWTEAQLDEYVEWFRTGKAEIMAKIPSVSVRSKKRARPVVSEQAVQTFSANVDVFQAGDLVHVCADLPGVQQDEDFAVQASGNVLRVRGRRQWRFPESAAVHVAERPVGYFDVRIELPSGLDASRIDRLEMRDGVLSGQIRTDAFVWRPLPVAWQGEPAERWPRTVASPAHTSTMVGRAIPSLEGRELAATAVGVVTSAAQPTPATTQTHGTATNANAAATETQTQTADWSPAAAGAFAEDGTQTSAEMFADAFQTAMATQTFDDFGYIEHFGLAVGTQTPRDAPTFAAAQSQLLSHAATGTATASAHGATQPVETQTVGSSWLLDADTQTLTEWLHSGQQQSIGTFVDWTQTYAETQTYDADLAGPFAATQTDASDPAVSAADDWTQTEFLFPPSPPQHEAAAAKLHSDDVGTQTASL